MGRGAALPVRCCSRASASSNTMVAAVSSTSECRDTSVNSVTRPCGPYTRPMSGAPIITRLLKVCASARAAAAVENRLNASVSPNSSAAALKYSSTG